MRFRVLLRLFGVFVAIFLTQKVIFMLYNIGMADGAPWLSCLAVPWHGLGLDVSMASYLMLLPAVVVAVSFFFRDFPLRRILTPYYWVAAVLLAVVFVADTVLYGFWGAKLDANDLIYAAKPKDMLASLPLWAIILAFLVVGFVTWIYLLLLRQATPRKLDSSRSRWWALLMLPLTGLLFCGMRGSVSESTANPSYAYFSSYPFCNHAALNPAFNMMHSLFKVQNLEREFNTFDENTLKATLGDAYRSDPQIADTLLSCSRPNILLVIWEGAGKGMVGSDSVAPNLHALMDEGVYFSNCYANSFRTDRGLVSVLSGWPGLPTASIMKRTDLCRCLPSIASSLQEVGYATSITYGGDIDFTNMRLYFSETGFASVRGGETFPSSLYQSAWGVPDAYLLTPDIIPAQRPFFAAALTLSSHEPWQVPMHRLSDPKRNSFAYTDSCLGVLVSHLRSTPLWDSLLVVIVPDHGITYDDARSTGDIRVASIPMVWVGGAVEKHCVVDCVMNQSDLAATLLAQMGVDASAFTFSRNVLSPTFASQRQFAVHSDKNHLNLVQPSDTSSYDCVSRTITPSNEGNRVFVEALLQQLYRCTADLPRHAKKSND